MIAATTSSLLAHHLDFTSSIQILLLVLSLSSCSLLCRPVRTYGPAAEAAGWPVGVGELWSITASRHHHFTPNTAPLPQCRTSLRHSSISTHSQTATKQPPCTTYRGAGNVQVGRANDLHWKLRGSSKMMRVSASPVQEKIGLVRGFPHSSTASRPT